MQADRKSVSQLSRNANAARGQGAPAGVERGETRSTRQGTAYHAGQHSSLLLTYKYGIAGAAIALLVLGLFLGQVIGWVITAGAVIFLGYFCVFLYWSSRPILSGLPGTVFYDDRERRTRRSYLFDADLGLHGSPDYIMEFGGNYYVVEYKTTVRGLPSRPSYKHLAQLVSYHVMLEKRYPGKMCDFGYVIYQSRASHRKRSFRYPIDDFMKREVLRNI